MDGTNSGGADDRSIQVALRFCSARKKAAPQTEQIDGSEYIGLRGNERSLLSQQNLSLSELALRPSIVNSSMITDLSLYKESDVTGHIGCHSLNKTDSENIGLPETIGAEDMRSDEGIEILPAIDRSDTTDITSPGLYRTEDMRLDGGIEVVSAIDDDNSSDQRAEEHPSQELAASVTNERVLRGTTVSVPLEFVENNERSLMSQQNLSLSELSFRPSMANSSMITDSSIHKEFGVTGHTECHSSNKTDTENIASRETIGAEDMRSDEGIEILPAIDRSDTTDITSPGLNRTEDMRLDEGIEVLSAIDDDNSSDQRAEEHPLHELTFQPEHASDISILTMGRLLANSRDYDDDFSDEKQELLVNLDKASVAKHECGHSHTRPYSGTTACNAKVTILLVTVASLFLVFARFGYVDLDQIQGWLSLQVSTYTGPFDSDVQTDKTPQPDGVLPQIFTKMTIEDVSNNRTKDENTIKSTRTADCFNLHPLSLPVEKEHEESENGQCAFRPHSSEVRHSSLDKTNTGDEGKLSNILCVPNKWRFGVQCLVGHVQWFLQTIVHLLLAFILWCFGMKAYNACQWLRNTGRSYMVARKSRPTGRKSRPTASKIKKEQEGDFQAILNSSVKTPIKAFALTAEKSSPVISSSKKRILRNPSTYSTRNSPRFKSSVDLSCVFESTYRTETISKKGGCMEVKRSARLNSPR